MNIACVLGFHKWDAASALNVARLGTRNTTGARTAKNVRAGANRATAHKWEGCKCPACGKVRNQGHDWSKDCQKCARCEAVRAVAHQWDGCKCLVCSRTRDQGHKWGKECEECKKCGKPSPEKMRQQVEQIRQQFKQQKELEERLLREERETVPRARYPDLPKKTWWE